LSKEQEQQEQQHLTFFGASFGSFGKSFTEFESIERKICSLVKTTLNAISFASPTPCFIAAKLYSDPRPKQPLQTNHTSVHDHLSQGLDELPEHAKLQGHPH
jgi:hypothetical protein